MAIITYTSRGRLETLPDVKVNCPICTQPMLVQDCFKVKPRCKDQHWGTQAICEQGCKNADHPNRIGDGEDKGKYYLFAHNADDLQKGAARQRKLYLELTGK